jgi:hypothetical protein
MISLISWTLAVYNVDCPVRVNSPVLHVIPDFGKEDLKLLRSPAEDASEERHAEAGYAPSNILMCPEAQVLVVRIRWPAVHGPLEANLADVDEAGINHLLAVETGTIAWPALESSGLEDAIAPLGEGAVGAEGAVIRASGQADVVAFKPASRRKAGEALAEETGPVVNRACHHSGEDEVEGLREGPVVLEVVYLKGEIRGHECWLYRTDVDTDNVCSWMVIGKVNRPGTGARTGIEAAPYGSATVYRAEVEPPVESKGKQVML